MGYESKKHTSSEQEGKTMSVQKNVANRFSKSTITKVLNLTFVLVSLLAPIEMPLVAAA